MQENIRSSNPRRFSHSQNSANCRFNYFQPRLYAANSKITLCPLRLSKLLRVQSSSLSVLQSGRHSIEWFCLCSLAPSHPCNLWCEIHSSRVGRLASDMVNILGSVRASAFYRWPASRMAEWKTHGMSLAHRGNFRIGRSTTPHPPSKRRDPPPPLPCNVTVTQHFDRQRRLTLSTTHASMHYGHWTWDW